MEARIVNFRLGCKTQNPRQAILEIEGIDTHRKAAQLIGRKVIWRSSSGLEIRGKIVRVHGKKGRVIATFRKPLPGQAFGTRVQVV